MLYPTFYKKKPCFFALIAVIIFSPILTAAESTTDSYKSTDPSLSFDFGIHPVGISQTTKSFYLCAKETDEDSRRQASGVTLITQSEEMTSMKRLNKLNRWNVPDSRNRINMRAWRKKTKKKQISVHIEAPYVTGKNPTAFQLNENQCHQNTLLPGTTCQFNVSFQPKGTGRQTASIIIPYTQNGEKNYLTVYVAGSGGLPKNIQKKVASIDQQ
ncbi:MAG: hypothetical protein HQK75_20720 [Candidatus Magnetomorum sp.]|nr:hypothetical protein [Candidatus Magnetomorum sp.]